MLKTTLIILTLTAGGETSMALTTATGPADCAAKADRLASVLDGAGMEVLAHRCAETRLSFTPYGHSPSSAPTRHAYRVTLPEGEGFEIAPLAAGEACKADAEATPAVHCVTSTQRVSGF